MTKLKLAIFIAITILCSTASALSPEAEAGKALFSTCNACHNQANDPPLGPPMWGVKRRYTRATLNKNDFVSKMVSFVKAPTLETAIHDKAVESLGLMPPLPLPDDMLKKIATYILEEDFPPPCDHWQIAVKRARKKGDVSHAQKDQRQFNRFCK